MLRTAFLVGAAVLVLGTACPARSQTQYHCVPDEPRETAPDRLVSVEITLRPNGEFASVVYRAANGAAYSRGQQYETTNGQDGKTGQHYWFGTLRANPNVAMVGSIYRRGDRPVYFETIHDKLQGGKIVSQVISICESIVAGTPPPQPSPAIPRPELNAFIDCVDAAIVALATLSSEPAQTIVDAAIGECYRERLALENTFARNGVTDSHELVDGLTKDARPNLLALVLNTRAAAARSSGGPTKGEPAKGQPL